MSTFQKFALCLLLIIAIICVCNGEQDERNAGYKLRAKRQWGGWYNNGNYGYNNGWGGYKGGWGYPNNGWGHHHHHHGHHHHHHHHHSHSGSWSHED